MKNKLFKKIPKDDWLIDIKKQSDFNIQKKDKPSEFDEPSICEYLFQFINDTSKHSLELGAWPYGANVLYISEKLGWRKLLIDNNNIYNGKLKKNLKVEWLDTKTIIPILQKYNCPKDLDLMSIDIDNNDYWILEKMFENGFEPKLIIFEFNPMFSIDESYVKKYFPKATKYGKDYRDFKKNQSVKSGNSNRTSWYGGSLGAFVKLGKRFGYDLIYVTPLDETDKVSSEKYKNKNGNNGFLLNTKYIRKNDKSINSTEFHQPFIESFKEKNNLKIFQTTNLNELKNFFIKKQLIQEI